MGTFTILGSYKRRKKEWVSNELSLGPLKEGKGQEQMRKEDVHVSKILPRSYCSIMDGKMTYMTTYV